MPQGSVLHLIVFLIYINDLPDKLVSKVHIFVYGMAIYLTIGGEDDSNVLY